MTPGAPHKTKSPSCFRQLARLPHFILDEGHRALGERFQDALFKLDEETIRQILTGTPVVNKPSDLLDLLQHCNSRSDAFQQEFKATFQNISSSIRDNLKHYWICRDRRTLPGLPEFLEAALWIGGNYDHRTLRTSLYKLLIKKLEDDAAERAKRAGANEEDQKAWVDKARRRGTFTITLILAAFDLSRAEFDLRVRGSDTFKDVLYPWITANQAKLDQVLAVSKVSFLSFTFVTPDVVRWSLPFAHVVSLRLPASIKTCAKSLLGLFPFNFLCDSRRFVFVLTDLLCGLGHR